MCGPMPPQSQGQAGPETRRARSAQRRVSGREQRKIAAEQAARNRKIALAVGAVVVVLVVGLIAFLVTRPPDAGPPVLAGEPLPATIPQEANAMGPADAPVTVVEWGDYT
jgi:hypothetical protein